MGLAKRRRILAIVWTDATFERAEQRLACARCNHGKGVRHDPRYASDPRARELVERLVARRRERWRDPPEGLLPPPRTDLPPPPRRGRGRKRH